MDSEHMPIQKQLVIFDQPSLGSWSDHEHACVYSLSLTPEVTNLLTPDSIRNFVFVWNRTFRKSSRMKISKARTLIFFNSSKKFIYFLNNSELDKFVDWIAEKLMISVGSLTEDVIKLAESSASLSEKVQNLKDILASLVLSMKNSHRSMNIVLASDNVYADMLQYFNLIDDPFRLSHSASSLSGHVAMLLQELGIRPVIHQMHFPYNGNRSLFNDIDCLVLKNDFAGIVPYDNLTECSMKNMPKACPDNYSFCIEYDQGLQILHHSGNGHSIPEDVTAYEDGRVNYQLPRCKSIPGKLKHITLKGSTDKIIIKDENCLLKGNLQKIPIFAEWKVENETLIIKASGDDTIKWIAEHYDSVIISGLEILDMKWLGVRFKHFIESELRRQLEVLRRKEVILHMKIVPPHSTDSKAILDIICRYVNSASISIDDLYLMTDGEYHAKDTYLKMKYTSSKSVFDRYQRADQLSRYLDLDKLYVHGDDVDLVLMKTTSEEKLRQEIRTILFARSALVAALIKQSNPDWKDILRKKVKPVLNKRGFVSLVKFARDYAKFITKRLDKSKDMQRLSEHIVLNGYHFCSREKGDYSVVIAPVFWPSLKKICSNNNTGDIVSALVTVLSISMSNGKMGKG